LAACLAACSSTPQEPHGSPVLVEVYWAAAGELQLVWANEPRSDMTNRVSPVVTEIDFVFDRRLDGSRLEDLVTMNGVTTAVPKNVEDPSMSAIHVGSTGKDPVGLVVDYNSVPRFGGDTAYVFARPQLPGVPAISGPLTFTFDTRYLTSGYAEPATVPADGVPVFVSPFSAAIAVGTSTVSPGSLPMSALPIGEL